MSTVSDKLYGTHTNQPAAEPAPSVPPNEAFASRLYKASPPAPATTELYPIERLIEGDVTRNIQKLAPRLQLSDADQAAERQTFNDLVRRTGLDADPALATKIHDLWTSARLREARADEPTGPEEAELAAARVAEATWTEAKFQFGAGFDALLARTKRYVDSDAGLLDIMSLGGLGSRADVVVPLMHHVQRHGLGR